MKRKSALEIAKELEATLLCNCDLDKWEPDKRTGHSVVCRIHQTAVAMATEKDRVVFPGSDI